MTRITLRTFAAISVLALSACASAPEAPQPAVQANADLGAGRRLAEVHCARCHAIGEAGISRHPSAPPFRTLSVNYPITALEEAFAEGVLVGHRDMPEFRLEPQQIEDLLGYIQSIQARRAG